MPATNRPATAKLSAAQVGVILFYSPAHAVERLVHAWAALADGQTAYAANRLACAKSEPVMRAVPARKRAAVLAEIDALTAAVAVAS